MQVHTGEECCQLVNLSICVRRREYLAMQCRSCQREFLSFKVTRPHMTSPRRWAWRSAAPFLSQLRNSPLLPLLTRSDDCLFPGAWNGGGGNAAGPRASLNPARKSKKRLNDRSCPAAAEGEPFVGQRQISLAASHKPRSCWRGRCAEERQPLDVVVGEREKVCSRLMLFDMPGDMNHGQIAESSFSLVIACHSVP